MSKRNVGNMNFVEYLESQCTNQAKFARKAGVTQPTLINVKKGKDIHLSTAKKIVDASDGLMSLESLANAITETNTKPSRR